MQLTKAFPPVNFDQWVEENRGLLVPPVGNKVLHDGDEIFVMVIGGPNQRNDFHKTDSEEWFFQVKGDIVVRVREDGHIIDVPVMEGESFFIPANLEHSPTRPPGTIGIVVERKRPVGEREHQIFYCINCGKLVRDNEFDCADIVQHFSQAMEAFWANPELNTCPHCGTPNGKPTPVKQIIFEPEIVIVRE